MYARCTTKKGAAQQRKLEQTLLAMMKETLYSDISVRGLCVEADISRKTFYRLFSGKEDVLCALIDHTYMDYVHYEPAESELVPGVLRELQTFFLYWRKQKELLDALKAAHKSGLLVERSVQHVLLDDSSTVHRLGADGSPYSREIILFFVSGIMTLIVDWHEADYQKSIPEMVEIMHMLLTSPPIKFPMPYDNL